jgi:hypothetical protein
MPSAKMAVRGADAAADAGAEDSSEEDRTAEVREGTEGHPNRPRPNPNRK